MKTAFDMGTWNLGNVSWMRFYSDVKEHQVKGRSENKGREDTAHGSVTISLFTFPGQLEYLDCLIFLIVVLVACLFICMSYLSDLLSSLQFRNELIN